MNETVLPDWLASDPKLAKILERIARALPNYDPPVGLTPYTLLEAYAGLIESGTGAALMTSHAPVRDPQVREPQTVRTLPPLLCEMMANPQEHDVAVSLTAMASSHLRWLIGVDPDTDPAALSTEDLETRVAASVEAYQERARGMVDAGLSDAFDVVQTLLTGREAAEGA